jgi:hypothetical protein
MRSLTTALALVTSFAAIAAPAFAADDVLASKYKLPKGFTSIQATEQPETKWMQIEALYTDPTGGGSLRFTTVRGTKDMAEPGRNPVDVCVRDGKSGEVLLPPHIAGNRPLIPDCKLASKEAGKDRSGDILEALDALTTVRFKDEYRAEYVALVNQSMQIVSEGKMPTAFGGGVIFHNKNPQLPTPQGKVGTTEAAPAAPVVPSKPSGVPGDTR